MALKFTLKADFHMHTKDDPEDFYVKHSAEELIDHAVKQGFEVLSITTHNKITYSPYLRDYAFHRGILLLPGVEVTIEGKHILLINYLGPLNFKRISDLKNVRGKETLIIAAHPFFPGTTTLKNKLIQNIELFDAIEYCHFYHRWVNFNKRAIEVSRNYQKPLLGTSDTHFLSQMNHTYSLLEVTQKTNTAVVEAIKKGDVNIVTQPLSTILMTKLLFSFGASLLSVFK